MRKACALAVLLVTAACGTLAASHASPAADAEDSGPAADATPAPRYSHDGRFLRDRLGRVLLLRGINVATGDLEHWKADDPDVEAKTFANIAHSGFDAVRLVLNWERIEPTENVFDPAYVALIAHHARLAAAQGLYVILDLHQDMYGAGFGSHGAPAWSCDAANYAAYQPIQPYFNNYFSAPVKACFEHLWKTPELQLHLAQAARELARAVTDVDEVLGFDPINEPMPGLTPTLDFDRVDLQPFYERFWSVVGPVLPDRLLFFEPAPTFGLSLQSSFQVPLAGFPGVFTPHYYNLSIELSQAWDGDADQVQNAADGAAGVAQNLQSPWAFGEMGGAQETPNLGAYLDELYRQLDAQMAGSFLWIYSRGTSGFGLIDAPSGKWNRHAASFLRPAPVAIGGEPKAFSWDRASGQFALTWQDSGKGATEILLPAWVQKVGYACTLDGETLVPVLNAAGTRIVLPAKAGARAFAMAVAGPYPAEDRAP